MERDGDRLERYCSTGQSPQRAAAPTEEDIIKKKSVHLVDLAHVYVGFFSSLHVILNLSHGT